MYKETVNYNDFDNNERSEELYFNLTQTEATEFALEMPNSLTDGIAGENVDVNQASMDILKKMGGKGVFDFLKKLVLKSYGIKSADGRRIEKSEKITREFEQSIPFDIIFTKLMRDDNYAAAFVNAVIPAELAARIAETTKNKQLEVNSEN